MEGARELLKEASTLVNSPDFKAKLWAEQAEELARLRPMSPIAFERWNAWQLILGLDKGVGYAILVSLLLAYNIRRGYLTYRVGRLRAQEERSGDSPSWSDYQLPFAVHRFLSGVLYFALISFAVNAWIWLTAPVLLPAL